MNQDGEIDSDDAIHLLRHIFLPDEYPIGCSHNVVTDAAIAPTCTIPGATEGSHCSICSAVFVEQTEIPALGHDEVSHDAKAATCSSIGWDEYVTCSRCDYSTYAEIAALGHDKVVHSAKAATCTEIGWKTYVTCARCNSTSGYQEIPALGHTDGDWFVDVDATCTEDGFKHRVCAVCDETIALAEIPARGHNYVNRVCTVCNEYEPSEGLAFTSNGDGTCYVSGIGTCTDTDLVIPRKSPAGDTVISIGYWAFQYCSDLTSVTFSDTDTWYVSSWSSSSGGSKIDVTDAAQNATYFKDTYYRYYWYKK